MPEITPFNHLVQEIATLGPEDVAHHSMLYPGIYHSDRELHEQMRTTDANLDTGSVLFRAIKTALNNGARIEWLCTLPRNGEFGCHKEDILIRRRMMGAIAALGVDVRAVNFSDIAPGIFESCGEHSSVVQDFQAGLERGDPRKSSWSAFRRQAGKLAISYLNTMDYDEGEFLGRMQHYPPGPVDPEIAEWTFRWREAYKQGERLSPLSS